MERYRASIAYAAYFAVLLGSALTSAAEEVTIYRPYIGPASASPIVPAVAVADPAPAHTSPSTSSYTVQAGDTLFSVARTLHVSVDALRQRNHLSSDVLKAGMVLTLPTAEKSPVVEVRKAEAVKPLVTAAPAPSVPATDVETQRVLQKKFLEETRALATQGVGYDASWRPTGLSSGSGQRWDMDCSNTTRYLYKKVTGIDVPRTASDQYYELHQKGLAWDAPRDDAGHIDTTALWAKLKVGDLLFWENTYHPERTPPITHVMIYLGKNKKGEPLMAGSQQGSGFFNVSGNGPDVYVFKPAKQVGGYSTNLGFTHIHGSFVAFGRPILEKPVQLANR